MMSGETEGGLEGELKGQTAINLLTVCGPGQDFLETFYFLPFPWLPALYSPTIWIFIFFKCNINRT